MSATDSVAAMGAPGVSGDATLERMVLGTAFVHAPDPASQDHGGGRSGNVRCGG